MLEQIITNLSKAEPTTVLSIAIVFAFLIIWSIVKTLVPLIGKFISASDENSKQTDMLRQALEKMSTTHGELITGTNIIIHQILMGQRKDRVILTRIEQRLKKLTSESEETKK